MEKTLKMLGLYIFSLLFCVTLFASCKNSQKHSNGKYKTYKFFIHRIFSLLLYYPLYYTIFTPGIPAQNAVKLSHFDGRSHFILSRVGHIIDRARRACSTPRP